MFYKIILLFLMQTTFCFASNPCSETWEDPSGRNLTEADIRKRIKDIFNDKETGLREKGYRSVFIDGLNEIHKGLKVIERMKSEFRKGQFDPKKNHVPEFSEKVEETLKFIKEGIIEQGIEVKERLATLNQFTQEARSRVNENKVTYNWWLKFILRLAILATPSSEREGIGKTDWWKKENFKNKDLSRSDYETLSSYLDDVRDFRKVFLPVVNQKLGIMALNLISSVDHVAAIELVNNVTIADGKSYWPLRHLLHDDSHGLFALFSSRFKRLYNYLSGQQINLNTEDVEKNELVFFMVSHEHILLNPRGKEVFEKMEEESVTRRLIKNTDKFTNPNIYGVFLPKSVDLNSKRQVQAYLKGASTMFFQTVEGIDISNL